jgi:hypothetical protein
VTLCAAGISYDEKPSIVLICDKKVSFFGGHFAGENIALKVTTIHESWSVMFAGENSPLVPLVDAIKSSAWRSSQNTLRKFARLCSALYRGERKKIIETDILSKYDISSYGEYRALLKTDSSLYDAITKDIETMEEQWNLLFFGYDKNGQPHVFVITEYGKIQFCDIEGFAAIGSGAWAAVMTLALLRYNQRKGLGDCVYRLLAAKFTAEQTADGVGEDTLIAVMNGKHTLYPSLSIHGEDIKSASRGMEAEAPCSRGNR